MSVTERKGAQWRREDGQRPRLFTASFEFATRGAVGQRNDRERKLSDLTSLEFFQIELSKSNSQNRTLKIM
jgi:hypothetical protein